MQFKMENFLVSYILIKKSLNCRDLKAVKTKLCLNQNYNLNKNLD